MKLFIILLSLILLTTATSESATINVPADQPTIQGGIDAAVARDTVSVAPGLYAVNLIFPDFEIFLVGDVEPSATILEPLDAALATITLEVTNSPGAHIRNVLLRSSQFNAIRIIRGQLSISNCRFTNTDWIQTSTPLRWSGAIWVGSLGSAEISRSLFADNNSPCIQFDGGSGSVTSNTMDNNMGGIFLSGSNGVQIMNNIVANSKGHVGIGGVVPGMGIFAASDLNTDLDYNNLYGNELNYVDGDGEAVAGTNDISADPLYSHPHLKDFSLLPASPCIDAGNPDSLFNDTDGSRGDIGAFLPCSVTSDMDSDGIVDCFDICPSTPNQSQIDSDSDGIGNVCDNCPFDSNTFQIDSDFDGKGDNCDVCPNDSDPEQVDTDSDGLGDVCDADDDNDGIPDAIDNCSKVFNPSQQDSDLDGDGDACDFDVDNDGTPDSTDNCINTFNSGQLDVDGDGIGDACDACRLDANDDLDGDGLCADVDNCPSDANIDQLDSDGDLTGDLCDNCISVLNIFQEDADGDGVGDACDACPTFPGECCCTVPGDFTGDDKFNITDVTFAIARIFSGGPPAPCQDEGDANGDNLFNIADVTYGIARIFGGGPAPVCGTTGT